ncbi:hypothetical protein A6A08_01810 [Nocardiopsis sp. TSRI0078]|uniref:hypothetical protein n=1 Tax=unclassified Nocardiopsis TaxID=2649073 RepID=UPI00093EA744|nr:hypothetical protein [Nocardiopsis sp. TSRI0078]OKI23539.1 hypothetical protein A6A08_01810 [Nocardiopsis sp. TSRI0078]
MSWEGIDHALNRVRGEADRIALDLTDLDGHVGHRMLRGADLVGRTRRRWKHADGHIHSLWTVYDAFRRVVDRARDLRVSGGGGPEDQALLTFLLNGDSVPLPDRDVPLDGRGLLHTDGESTTLAAAVARMSADYEEATEVISAVETAWDALHPRLAGLDAMWHEICTLSDLVGLGESEHEALRADLDAVGTTVRCDPLSLVEGGHVDTSSLEGLRLRLERVRGELRDALRMRDSYTESVERLRSAIDGVGEVLARVRRLREQVVAKISSPHPIEVPDPLPGLRDGIADMDALRSRSRWRELGARFGELQRTVHEAADDAHGREADLTGLLHRRAELRGRLDAYRARAVRLGVAEDERLVGLHRVAHWELWTAPCDLRAATVALSSYQRALQELGGTGTPANRTTPDEGASDGESDGGVSR